MSERFLVTGVLGCLGAWVARACSTTATRRRLRPRRRAQAARPRARRRRGRVDLVRGDITDLDSLERALDHHEITRVVHLAALQVPFVRANPRSDAGQRRAAPSTCSRRCRSGSTGSPGWRTRARPPSTAPPTLRPPPRRAAPSGHALRRLEARRRGHGAHLRGRGGLPSAGLRPYVVYGPGRDQGMTSGPTTAMLAAARGEPYAIGYTGTAQYDYAPDVARAFVMAAARRAGGRRRVQRSRSGRHDRGRRRRDPRSRARRGDHVVGRPAPFPPELESVGFDRDVGRFPRTPLEVGVAATIEHFRATR